MHVIHARNVNDAYVYGFEYLMARGDRQPSRNGEVIVSPLPVTTCYSKPMERVLFCPNRDANPFFHLGEALWMLAGRNDATWLDRFVSDFSERFAENGVQHGAYGHRWRRAFGIDQLDAVVARLKKDPNDRQCVIQMWDAAPDHGHSGYEAQGSGRRGGNDLLGVWKDRPCNTHIYLRVREELIEAQGFARGGHHVAVLDITVCCRSNDLVWGAYGANAVHFSVLQEYLAARIGVGVGAYYQISNNFHVYTDVLKKIGKPTQNWPYDELKQRDGGVAATQIVTHPESFDTELTAFLAAMEADEIYVEDYRNKFLLRVAWPMFKSYKAWRAKDRELAWKLLNLATACDWTAAARDWFDRRMAKAATQRSTR